MTTLELRSIHTSFTKKDLCKIIEKFNLNINVNLNRNNICKELLNHVEEYNLEYLYEENKFKKLSIKEKDNVILIAKKIKSFVKSGLDLNKNLYNSNDDAISDAIYIGQYGDISSVRKAITLLNTALNIQIPIIISENLKKSLDEKVEIKKKSVPTLQIKYGKFYVDFQ